MAFFSQMSSSISSRVSSVVLVSSTVIAQMTENEAEPSVCHIIFSVMARGAYPLIERACTSSFAFSSEDMTAKMLCVFN